MNIAAFIDHTLLTPTATVPEVDALCNEAIHFGFAAVCVPPVYLPFAAGKLRGTPVKLATVIGFPFGYTYTAVKKAEAAEALENGAQELDMVMNITALKNKDYSCLKSEVDAMLALVRESGAVLKVIIESGILSDAEIIKCCEIYGEAGVDFLKTSTGYAVQGATVEAVALMRKKLPPTIQIKASGGIRNYAFAKSLLEAGAARLGCSASVAIIKGEKNTDTTNY